MGEVFGWIGRCEFVTECGYRAFLYVECLLNLFDPGEIFRMRRGILPGASHPQEVIDSHTVKKLPPKPKNFPQEHPPKTKRTKSSHCIGGCSWGKFSEGQGGLEGRRPSPKEGLLRLQGLSPLPLPYSTPPTPDTREDQSASRSVPLEPDCKEVAITSS